MSQENVELVRRLFEAAARRDTAALFDLYDPYVVWDASRTERGAITGKVVQGRDALLKWLREWYEPWETVDDILEELIDASKERVVSVMVQRGRGRVSGVEVENRLGTVWTIQDGKVIRVVWFPSREEALEAVGLKEQAMSKGNVDLVRSIMAAWERGDYRSAEWAHPEIEAVIADGPSPRSSTGLAGMAAGWGDFLHAWEGFHHKVEEYRDLDGERVLALVHWAGRGKSSGLEVAQMTTRAAVLFHVRDRKVTRVVAYLDREHALADLGLSE